MPSADAASEPQHVHATVLRKPPDVLPLAASNLASEFLLEPDSSGGGSERKGFEFQDRYIAYALAGLLKDRETLLYVRIEGIEDLDALVLKSGVPVERHYQMKSISGAGPWSPKSLVSNGVLGRPIRLSVPKTRSMSALPCWHQRTLHGGSRVSNQAPAVSQVLNRVLIAEARTVACAHPARIKNHRNQERTV